MLYGPDECLKRCGLTRPEVPPRAQQQARIAGNAFPASVLAEVTPIPTPTSIALYTADASPTASSSWGVYTYTPSAYPAAAVATQLSD